MTKKDLNELEKVVVKSHDQLVKALEPFMAETTIRKLLIEGMDIVKRQDEFITKSDSVKDIDYGGFPPARPKGGHRYSWVDTLIDRRLDGKRNGLKVTWSLSDGQYEFDPWTQKLDKIS
jgi:hypothetical protein